MSRLSAMLTVSAISSANNRRIKGLRNHAADEPDAEAITSIENFRK
jgi:hypothetical protein